MEDGKSLPEWDHRRRSPGRKGTPQAEPDSKLAQTVAEVLRQHVVLEVESIDRMYLNAIVPRLQIVEGALRFIRQQRGAKVISTNAVEPMTRGLVQAIERFMERNGIPLIQFPKGQRKDELATRMRAQHPQRDGVVLVGKAQEKCTVYRTENATIPSTSVLTPGS